jgi:MFS family permease
MINLNLRWFLLAMVLANIAGQMAYSLLSVYLVDNLGASVSDVGLVFTIASLVPLALQLFGGWLSDTIGRLRAIALGSSFAVFGYLLFFLAPSWQWVLIGLSIEYVSGAFVAPSFGAYIAEQSTETQRGKVFGLSRSIYMIVTVIGPALAGFIAYRSSFRSMFLVALTFYALATIIRIWMASAERFAPSRPAEKPTLSGLKTQVIAMFALLISGGLLTWIWITDAVNDVSFNLIGQLYPVYLIQIGGMNVEQIGLLNSAWGAASILGALLAGWLADSLNERHVIAGGFALEAVGLLILLQVDNFTGFLVSMFFFGFGLGGLIPAYDSLVSKAVPEDRRGIAFGLFGTSLGILSLPFPWIGAQLWEKFSPQAPFWVAVIAGVISIPIAWFKFILPPKDPVDPAVNTRVD